MRTRWIGRSRPRFDAADVKPDATDVDPDATRVKLDSTRVELVVADHGVAVAGYECEAADVDAVVP